MATPYTFTASAAGSLPAVPATSNTFSVSKYGPATQLVFSAQPSGVDGTSASAVFPGQPAVTVEDSFGNVVNSASSATNPVTLNITGGEILGGCSQNWSLGVDTFSGCHGNAYATGLKLIASSPGLTSATSTAFNISGAATHLVFIRQPMAGASGATLTTQPVIAFEDATNQVVTSSTSAITLASSGGSLTLCTGLAPVLGVATLGNCTFTGLVNTPYTLTATATNSLNQVITGTSSTFTPISPGVPSQLVFTTQPIAGNSESVFTTQPVISVEDAGGNVVTTSTLGVTLTASGGTLSSCSGLSAVAGVINVSNCTFAGVVGTQYSLTATPTSGPLPSATSGFFSPTGPGAVSAVTSTVVASPSTVLANGIATSTVTVTLEDSYGNVVPGRSVTLSAGGGNSTITTISATTDANGVATFSVADLNPESVVYSATDATDSIALTQTATVQFISHPAVVSATPTPRGQGANGQTITINGSGFMSGATVAFSGTGIIVNSTSYVSPIDLSANISISGTTTTGPRNVTVTNPDGGTGTGTGVFTVTPAPIVTSTLPSSRDDGAVNQSIVINGSGFTSGSTVAFSNPGIAIVSATVNGPTTITAVISIASNALPGVGNITVMNTDAGVGVGTNVFTVNGPPTVTSTNPPTLGQGATNRNLTISGTNFVNGATVAFSGAGVSVNSAIVSGPTSITANVSISASASIGARDVIVFNGDGTTATGTGVFTVSPAPTLTSISPSSAGQGAVNRVVVITGGGFVNGGALAAIFSNPGITVNSTTFVSATTITATISISGSAAIGAGSVSVINGDAGVSSGSVAFSVNAAPLVTAVSPSSRGQGAANQSVTITGSGFVSGATLAFANPGITVNSSNFVSSTTITANISISGAATVGAGNVTVTNPDAGVGTGANAFTVNAAPTVISTTPSSLDQGAPSQLITITGSGFATGATVTFSGAGITLTSTNVVNATTITAQVAISGSAPIGASNVTVTNLDAGVGTGSGIFTVNGAPTVTSTAPSSLGLGASSQLVTINGTNFLSGATVSFSGTGITTASPTVVNANVIQVYVTTSIAAATGVRNVTVLNGDGTTATGIGIFTINASPTITSISPTSGGQGGTLNVTISGNGFVNGGYLSVNFSDGAINVNSTNYVSSTTITANITIPSWDTNGAGSVTVTNGDGTTVNGSLVFTVNPAPTLSNNNPIQPTSGAQGSDVNITINGSGFANGATVAFAVTILDSTYFNQYGWICTQNYAPCVNGISIVPNSITVTPTRITATIAISGSASNDPNWLTQYRDVIVTNPDGGQVTGVAIFQVQ